MAEDKKISQLNQNPNINGSEEIAEERGGSNYKNTLQDLKDWVLEGIAPNGVESVTGQGVDNSDPQNPVLSFPDTDSEVTETTDKKYVTDVEKTKINSSVNSTTIGEPIGSDVVLNTVSLTQSEYDAGTPDSTQLFI